MTKENFIDLIKSTARRVDPTSAFHESVIEMHLGRTINTMLYEIFRNNASNLDLYTKSYTVPIVQVGTKKTAVLPVSIVQFPDVGDGVRAIRPTGQAVAWFYPMTIQQADNYVYMEYSEYVQDTGYVVKNTTVEFVDLPQAITEVEMDLVRPFEAYAYTEEFYVPAGQDEIIIRKTLEIIGVITPVNLVNSNSDGQPNRG